MSEPPLQRIEQALGRALGGAAQLGRALTTALLPPGSNRSRARRHDRPGAPPGIEHRADIHTPPADDAIHVHVMEYSQDRMEEREVLASELPGFLATPRPDWAAVRWIDVDGLHPWVVERLRLALGYHTLAAEDVLHVPQRPAVEPYGDHLFVKARALMLDGELLVSEQVSLFLFPGTLLTIQERPGDTWAPVRERLRRESSRSRGQGADFLLYALLDAVVDHCFPLLESYGDMLERLEERVLAATGPEIQLEVQRLRRELAAIRRVLWPTREMIDGLARREMPVITEPTQVFLRDVYSHSVQLLEILESQRETCAALSDLHMSAVSNRMNEVMKVLTIMASLFIPVTFLAGVYGMNFEHMPELRTTWGYGAFWVISLVTIGALLAFFRRRRWL